jgi:hypothetical protein
MPSVTKVNVVMLSFAVPSVSSVVLLSVILLSAAFCISYLLTFYAFFVQIAANFSRD